MSKPTQTQRVLERLKAGPLTQLEALTELGVMRLGARILELREQGHQIRTETVEVATRVTGETAHVARYVLACEHLWLSLPGDGFGARQCQNCGLVTGPAVAA